MRKVFVFVLFTCFLCGYLTIGSNAQNEKIDKTLYHDVLITSLKPTINKAVEDYYKNIFKEIPSYSVESTIIKDIQRPNGDRTEYFILEMEIEPYLGPHIVVGRDNIIIELKSPQFPVIIEFRHLIDYPLPENKRGWLL